MTTRWILVLLYAMVATFIFEMLRRGDIKDDSPEEAPWQHIVICAFAAAAWPALLVGFVSIALRRKTE